MYIHKISSLFLFFFFSFYSGFVLGHVCAISGIWEIFICQYHWRQINAIDVSFRRYLEFLAYSCTGNRLKLSSSPHSHSTSLNREIQIWRLWKYLTLENKVSPNFHPLETFHFDEVLPDVVLTTGWVNLKACGDTLTGVHPVPFRLLLFFSLHFII